MSDFLELEKMKTNVIPLYNLFPIHKTFSFTIFFLNFRIKCISDNNRDMNTVFPSASRETTSKVNDRQPEIPTSAVVEVEVAETVTVKNNSNKNAPATCCCCPPMFNGSRRRSHVCYCPLYDVKQVLCPVMTINEQEDSGCGNKIKCCVQPFLSHCMTYSICPNDGTGAPQNIRE